MNEQPKAADAKAVAFPWVTRTQAAALISLSARQFDDVIKPQISEQARRGTGSKLRYDAPTVVAAYVAYRIKQEVVPADVDDPLMATGGNDSPQLERYRRARADLAEREVKEIDRKLVRREVLLNALRSGLANMRSVAEQLVVKFGNDAAEIYNTAVGEFIAAVERTIQDTAPEGEPLPPSPVAPAPVTAAAAVSSKP